MYFEVLNKETVEKLKEIGLFEVRELGLEGGFYSAYVDCYKDYVDGLKISCLISYDILDKNHSLRIYKFNESNLTSETIIEIPMSDLGTVYSL